MLFTCGENKTSVAVDFSEENRAILHVHPFKGSLTVRIDIEEGYAFRALCSHLHQAEEAFTIPQCVSAISQVPPQSYFIVTSDHYGYTAYFCLSHSDLLTSLSGTAAGLVLTITNSCATPTAKTLPALVCFRDKQLHQAIYGAVQEALLATGGMGRLVDDKVAAPAWLEYLGWESGVAMGKHVSHEKIIEAIKSLSEEGLLPGFVLVDEGWQQLAMTETAQGKEWALAGFDADKKRFPQGIKGVVDALHALGVKHVGVWHGMVGYRGGIHPSLAERYGLPLSADGRYYLGADLGQTFQFFHDYYGALRTQGVTFVKVGDQSSIHHYSHEEVGVTTLYRNSQAAIQAAASIQFTSAHLNTECLRNENLFYWSVSRIARTAEDIDMSNPLGMMRAIRNNLTNSLWLQHLMQPDFDAWLTNMEESETLAIFHALSGSINVIGDPAGKHNEKLIKKFVLPDGRLLKADRPLTLCEDSVFCNPLEDKQIYKAFTTKGHYGVVAAFNLNSGKRTLHGSVCAADVTGLAGEQFALFSYHNGFVKLVAHDEPVAITLKPTKNDVFTFAPLRSGVAVMGCYWYILAPGTISEVHIEEDSVHISSLVAAPLLLYCSRQVLEVRRDGKAIPWEHDNKRFTLSIDHRKRIVEGHALYSIIFES